MKASASTASLLSLCTALFRFESSGAFISPSVGSSSSQRSLAYQSHQQQYQSTLFAKKAGTFFNPVPEEDDDTISDDKKLPEPEQDMDSSIQELIKSRNLPSKASEPSTIKGVPTSQAGLGFGSKKVNVAASTPKSKAPAVAAESSSSSAKPFIGIGPASLNDVTKPEYDDQGYTVYTNEDTGEKSRVFEALVDYPTLFVMKIVGASEGLFVEEMVAVVADSCNVEAHVISHTYRCTGKWTSVTVHAPVESANMLYELYEAVDKDPRVKFKF